MQESFPPDVRLGCTIWVDTPVLTACLRRVHACIVIQQRARRTRAASPLTRKLEVALAVSMQKRACLV